MARLHFVVKDKHFHKRKVQQLLASLKVLHDVNVIIGQSILDTQSELKKLFLKEDVLIIVGGDGTIHHSVQAFDNFFKNGQAPTVAVFPLGSGNDFVRTFGIPKSVAQWLLMFEKNNTCAIDIGFIEIPHNRYYVTSTSVGVSAVAAQLAQRPSILPPRLKYLWATVVAITRIRKFELLVSTPQSSNQIHSDTVHAVVANTPFFGSGLVAAKVAHPTDGTQNFVAFCGSFLYLVLHCVSILRGNVSHLHCTRSMSSSAFTLSTKPSTFVQADGEVIGQTPMSIRTIPNALRLIVPAYTSKSATLIAK